MKMISICNLLHYIITTMFYIQPPHIELLRKVEQNVQSVPNETFGILTVLVKLYTTIDS